MSDLHLPILDIRMTSGLVTLCSTPEVKRHGWTKIECHRFKPRFHGFRPVGGSRGMIARPSGDILMS